MKPLRARLRFIDWFLIGAILLGVIMGVLVINAPGVSALYYQRRFGPAVAALPAAPGFASDDRVLMVSPHPDDESLCCAGMIQQALASGAEVYIVWLTSGDGFELDAVLTERTVHPGGAGLQRLGFRRISEAKAAASVLGVPEENLYFLDYPDGGLQRMFLDYYETPYASRYTGLQEVSYAGAYAPGSAYTGANLERDLSAVVDAVNPSIVLAPSPEDHHPDHRTAGDLILRILGRRGEPQKARWWIVHGGLEWPLPKGLHRSLPLYPPPRGRGLPWQRVDLEAGQLEVKEEAIRQHVSQLEALRRFMEAFIRSNELVSPEPLPELPPRTTP